VDMVKMQVLSSLSLAFAVATDTCTDSISTIQTNAARSRKGQSSFALHSLGPFHLVGRPDLVGVFELNGNTWKANSATGLLATTLKTDTAGRDFWQSAFEVDWAYQPKIVSGSGSFEKYGGFVLKAEDRSVQRLLEISPVTDSKQPEMTVNFGKPFIITAKDWNTCANPADITIRAFWDKGAQQYCWHVSTGPCERGCFYYKTTLGFQAFAVQGFALQSLGPFPLSRREDLLGLKVTNTNWHHVGQQGSLASALPLASGDYWGASRIEWAYQAQNPVSNASFEKYGGFVALDVTSQVTKVLEIDLLAANPELTLHFSPPFHVSSQMWDDALVNGGSGEITIEFFKQAGAQRYSWFVDDKRCANGCFLYQSDTGYFGFAVVQEFAIPKLGPFPLFARDDLRRNIRFNKKKLTWKLKGDVHVGSIAKTKEFQTAEALQYWLGRERVDWAYQSSQVKANMLPTPGSFEMFG